MREFESSHILSLPLHLAPLEHERPVGLRFSSSRRPALQLEGPRDRGIVLCVNTVYPAEVKIVPSSILSRQSQRRLGPKTIFGHGSRCPQTGPRGRACEGNFWHRSTPGRGENELETMWFMRTLEGRRGISASLYLNSRHSMGGSDL